MPAFSSSAGERKLMTHFVVKKINWKSTHYRRGGMIKKFFFLLVFFATLNTASAQTLPPEVLHYADLVFYNGKIVTLDDKSTNLTPGTVVEAVAIREGKILALGRTVDIKKYGGPKTAMVDVKGRTVIPGLIDTHGHIHEYALEHWGPKLAVQVRGKDMAEVRKTLAATLKDEAAKVKPGEWIAVDMRFTLAIDLILNNKLTKQELNRMAPKNPVLLIAHPAYLVNDTAIRDIEKFFGYRLTKEDIDKERGQPLQGTDFRRGLFWDVIMENKYEEQAEAVRWDDPGAPPGCAVAWSCSCLRGAWRGAG